MYGLWFASKVLDVDTHTLPAVSSDGPPVAQMLPPLVDGVACQTRSPLACTPPAPTGTPATQPPYVPQSPFEPKVAYTKPLASSSAPRWRWVLACTAFCAAVPGQGSIVAGEPTRAPVLALRAYMAKCRLGEMLSVATYRLAVAGSITGVLSAPRIGGASGHTVTSVAAGGVPMLIGPQTSAPVMASNAYTLLASVAT